MGRSCPLDVLVVASACLGFGAFAASHVIAFRYFKPRGLAGTFLGCFLIGLAVVALAWARALSGGAIGAVRPAALSLGAGAALFLYGFLFLIFISWIFGVGESSVRMRILCELNRGREGSSLGEIEAAYSVGTLLETRLSRLVAGGQLRFDGHRYRWNASSLLSCQLRVIDALSRFLGHPA